LFPSFFCAFVTQLIAHSGKGGGEVGGGANMIAINAAKVSRLLNRGHLINLARNAIEKGEKLRSFKGMKIVREIK